MLRRSIAGTIGALLLAGHAAADVRYTPTNGPTCKDYSKPQFGHWVCPGPGGYAIAFSDEGNIAGLKRVV